MILPHRHPPRGAILLSLVLILGVVGTATLFLLAQSNLSGVTDTSDQTKSSKVRAVVFGCLDEALIQFTKNPAYAPTSIVTPTATCTSTVTDLGGTSRRVELSYASLGITRKLTATVSVSPVAVTGVLEQ